MRRLHLLVLVTLGVLVFAVVSVLLARALNAEGVERSQITAIIDAEARGDTAGVVSRLHGCGGEPACPTGVSAWAPRVRRPGTVQILQLQPSTGFSLGGTDGIARVAWNTTAQKLPVVQCVHVRRTGNVVRGLTVELLALTAPIRSDADCPAHLG